MISPGGVGYDINCGVRLLISDYSIDDLKEKILPLVNQIQRDVPSGIGRGGRLKLSMEELNDVLKNGVNWALRKGHAYEEDLENIEENGCFKEAVEDLVSERAKHRGADQLGTLGSGNHFIELQKVTEIFDEITAKIYGMFVGQIAVMIHTGSRGLGHQNCTDYVQLMNKVMPKYEIRLKDPELACAPFQSKEGQNYFHAMAACANFAWTNRQMITANIRNSWRRVLGNDKKNDLKLVYDVAHNMAKIEIHNGKKYIVHRKGATRAF